MSENYFNLFISYIQDCASRIYKVLNDDSNKTLDYKLMQLRNEFDRQGMLLYCRDVNGLGRQFDKYTEALFKDYESNKWKYEKDAEYEFLKEMLNDIKGRFKDENHLIPENYNLDLSETLELLAKRNALMQARSKLFNANFTKEDTIESVYEKLITSDSIKSNEIVDELIEEKNEFTVRQKTLMLLRVLNEIGVYKERVGAKAIAEFIHRITGNNYKNIYDFVREPELNSAKSLIKRDSEIINSEFEKLGIKKIID